MLSTCCTGLDASCFCFLLQFMYFLDFGFFSGPIRWFPFFFSLLPTRFSHFKINLMLTWFLRVFLEYCRKYNRRAKKLQSINLSLKGFSTCHFFRLQRCDSHVQGHTIDREVCLFAALIYITALLRTLYES